MSPDNTQRKRANSPLRRILVLALLLLVFVGPNHSLFAQTVESVQELAIRKGWQWVPSSDGFTHIAVCWENGHEFTDEKNWVQEAIGATWQAVARLNFSGWRQCTSASRGIRIVIEDVRSHSLVGSGIDGRPNGMSLNFTFNNFSTAACKNNREYCIKSIAVHEFGHALGFIHEQDRPDSICYEGRRLNLNAGQLTPYDADSIMNYCNRKWNNDGNLSAFDIQGVRKIYGSRMSNGYLTVTDELGDNQISEKATMSLRGSGDQTGSVHVFNLDSSQPSVTKRWNFFGTGRYHYRVETLTTLRDGTSMRGFAEGTWTLTQGEIWELTLYLKDWNPAGYWNLELKGKRKNK